MAARHNPPRILEASFARASMGGKHGATIAQLNKNTVQERVAPYRAIWTLESHFKPRANGRDGSIA